MTILEGLLQGILQGLTEFLPVSSSGHLVLFQHFTGTSGEGALFFNLMLHLGTLVAVCAAYYEDIWQMLKELGSILKEIFSGKFHFATDKPHRKLLYMLVLATLPLVLVVPLRKVVAQITADDDIIIEGICFLITAGLLFLGCKVKPRHAGVNKMKPRHALTIGVMQGIATLPGISRSGSTISTGLFLGFDRAFMVKFSFLLGIPAILGGAVFEIGDAVQQGTAGVGFGALAVGMLAAAIVGYLSIRLVRWLVLSNKFIIFAWYTLALGIVVIVIGIVEKAMGGMGDATSVVSSIAQSVSQVASGT